MVKNKNTGQMRDFAFIEFYTIDVCFIFVLILESKNAFCCVGG